MKYIFPLLSFLFLGLYIKTNAQVVFEKTYGGANNEFAGSVIPVGNSGYMVFGWTQSYGQGLADYYLIRTDINGDTIWTKTYGAWGSESGWRVKPTSDGGYLLVGTTRSIGAGAGDGWLVKVNSTGNIQWSQTYGGFGEEYFRDAEQTADGGYIVTGFTSSYGNGGQDIYLVKVNANGVQSWYKTFGGGQDEESFTVRVTSDGGYVIAGWSKSYGNGNADFYLIKTDAQGIVSWTKTYGGSGSDSGVSVEQTADGGYIFAGTTRSYGAGAGDVWLIKTNSTGDTLWTKTYGGSGDDYGHSVCITSNGYAICGFTQSSGAGQSDVYVIETNNNGTVIQSQTFGGSGADEGWLITVHNNDLLVVGTKTNAPNGVDAYFIKISRGASVNEHAMDYAIEVYPSPANDVIHINGNFSTNASYSIIDMSGKCITKQTLNQALPYAVDITSLANGVYVFSITSGGKTYNKKFIKN